MSVCPPAAVDAPHQDVPYQDVLELEALPCGGQHSVQLGLVRVLLCRRPDGQVVAMRDLCPHARQPLSGGTVDALSVTCPKHGARFDLASGAPLNAVCKRGLTLFDVRIDDGRILVAVDPSAV